MKNKNPTPYSKQEIKPCDGAKMGEPCESSRVFKVECQPEVISFSVPIKIRLGKTRSAKLHSLNMNQYRNWHFRTSNALKIKFNEICKKSLSEAVDQFPRFSKLAIVYDIWLPSKRRTDIGNWGSVIQKFTEDSLVSMGVIEDDSFDVVYATCSRFAGIDAKNPRCVVTLKGMYDNVREDEPSLEELSAPIPSDFEQELPF